VIVNQAHLVIDWNGAAETLYGWKTSETLGRHVDKLLPMEDASGQTHWPVMSPEQNSWQGELRQQCRDGNWLDIQGRVEQVRDAQGQVQGEIGIFRDMTKSKQLAQELHERDQLLASAVELARLGIWSINLTTREVYTSPISRLHLGFAPDQEIDYAIQSKGVYEAEYHVTWPDGSSHWIASRGQGQYGADGQATSVNGVTLDITVSRLQEERKDTFIGMASHELKTPLTTVKGFTQLLKRQLRKLDMRDQVTTLTKMEEQINSLNRLVSELLDVTRIQAGKLEYIWAEVNIDRLIREVTDMHQQNCKHRIKVSGTIRRTITGDRAHLSQVFTNLLTNAIKYSPYAKRVDVRLYQMPDVIQIKIQDYGMGIPQAEIPHIFERFYRVEAAKNRAIQGLGMGLYIAQEIVQQHGGKLSVESTEGAGSTFCVELPCSFKPEVSVR
jgi:PAS domain S-box-containing protein